MKMSFLRKVLIGLTSLIWLAGAASVGLAGYVMVKDMKFKGLTGNKIIDGVILGMACFVFVLGLVGCLGVTLQKRAVLKIFFILLLLFFLLQLGVVIDFLIQRSQIQGLWIKSWPGMTDEGRISIQKELKCCGLSSSDLNNHASYNDTSCFTSAAKTTRREACFDALVKWLNTNIIIISVSGGLLCLLELIMMITTCLFIREIGRQTTVVPLKGPRIADGQPSYQSNQAHASRVGNAGLHSSMHPMVSLQNYDYDDYLPEPMEHTRRDWAKHNHRREWQNQGKTKR